MFWLAMLLKQKGTVFGWALVGCLLALALSFSIPNRYVAQVTLQVDEAGTTSPLLTDLSNPAHVSLLQDILKTPSLLADTARDTGVIIHPSGLKLAVPSPRLIRIRYASNVRANLERATDALAYNFIYELLAPERLRLEQRLARLNATMDAPGVTEAQKQAATEEQQNLQSAVQAIAAAFQEGTPQAVIWFAEAARMQPYTPPSTRHINYALLGLLLGLIIGVLVTVWRSLNPKGPRTEEDLIKTSGLSSLGLWPDIGHVTLEDGMPTVRVGQTKLNPIQFTEVIRLHRALTRGLHGSLLVTGVEGGEGTSTLALLFAQKSAEAGKKTLIVDLNLKNNGLTRALGQSPNVWKLPARKKLENVSDIAIPLGPNLSLLPAPSDAGSVDWVRRPENAGAFLDALTSNYEHVILDTTPVTALNRQNADSVVLVGAATRSVLLVLMGITPFDKLAQVSRMLSQYGNVVGVIGNNRFNPSAQQIVLGALATLGKVAPGLAAWLRAKAQS
ncbi:MAG: hypothetical protein COY40_00870 [Alphaproteobacteria bacterium CG_4_10_14_0_8_um_filter_53_9]|nr:MAG: hypothetical protein COY40_00870 [Alphaproteobacteria bacterium CG_4_10_14_0_8_um_filter_53_9]